VDAVILIRFDVRYRYTIDQLGIQWEKVNLAFRGGPYFWNHSHRVCDLFHVSPYCHIQALRKALDYTANIIANPLHSGHNIYDDLTKSIGISNVHFITNEYRASTIHEDEKYPTFLFLGRSCNGFSVASLCGLNMTIPREASIAMV
jgi:hypothetical protein